MPKVSYKYEIYRKLIHLSALWIPVAIFYMERAQAALLFLFLTLVVWLIEVSRYRDGLFARFFTKFFGRILRQHEHKRFTGLFHLNMAAFLSVLLFQKPVAVAAFSIVVVSDAAAALIGRKFGRRAFFGKTVEGTLAFLVSGIAVVWTVQMLTGQPAAFLYSGIAAVAIAAFVEVFAGRVGIDDNLAIALSMGIAMTAGLMLWPGD